MGNTHRHWSYYECSFTQSRQSHTYQTTTTSRSTRTYSSDRRESIEIYGIKEVTLVHDDVAIPATFIICDVNCAILGLDTITKNKLQLN
eukprot:2384470-Amphidinium_carterae.1